MIRTALASAGNNVVATTRTATRIGGYTEVTECKTNEIGLHGESDPRDGTATTADETTEKGEAGTRGVEGVSGLTDAMLARGETGGRRKIIRIRRLRE